MEQRARVGNRLLAALPPADLDLLVRHFRMVELERDAVLVRSGDPIGRIYFPLSGLVAFIMDMPSGQTVATAIVGNESAIGVLSTLGPIRSPMTAVVRVAGLALQISPTRFQSALGRSNALNAAVQTLNRALMAQFQHVAACNALHSVEARLPRWLLHVHDRADGDVLPLTQETLAEFLGVRRTTVTQVISKLREFGRNQIQCPQLDRDRQTAARSGGMRMLPAHAPQNRSYRFDSGDDAARHTRPGGISARSPCSPRRTKSSALGTAWHDRAAGKGPLTEWQQKSPVVFMRVAEPVQLAARAVSRSAREPRPPWQTIRGWFCRSNRRCARKTPGCNETVPDPLPCPSE